MAATMDRSPRQPTGMQLAGRFDEAGEELVEQLGLISLDVVAGAWNDLKRRQVRQRRAQRLGHRGRTGSIGLAPEESEWNREQRQSIAEAVALPEIRLGRSRRLPSAECVQTTGAQDWSKVCIDNRVVE